MCAICSLYPSLTQILYLWPMAHVRAFRNVYAEYNIHIQEKNEYIFCFDMQPRRIYFA